MKAPTGTNVFALARTLLENKGQIPARVPASSYRHIVRCIAGDLVTITADGRALVTDLGWEAIAADSWHDLRDGLTWEEAQARDDLATLTMGATRQ